MDVKEFEGVLDSKLAGLKTQVETKNTEFQGSLSALESQLNDYKEKGISAEQFETMQKHLDSLDIRVQGQNRETAQKKSFGSILEQEILAKSDEIAKFERKETKSFSLEYLLGSNAG